MLGNAARKLDWNNRRCVASRVNQSVRVFEIFETVSMDLMTTGFCCRARWSISSGIIPRSNKKPERDGDSTISHLALAAIAQNKFEAEIDMARPGARQHQSGRGSADGIAVNADGAEAWRDQLAHFQIAQPNDGDRLRRGRT